MSELLLAISLVSIALSGIMSVKVVLDTYTYLWDYEYNKLMKWPFIQNVILTMTLWLTTISLIIPCRCI